MRLGSFLKKNTAKFSRDESGAIAIVFAVVAPLLLATVGAAVDYSYTAKERTKGQAAADAAALAAIIEANRSTGTKAERKQKGIEAGQKAFDSNKGHINVTSRVVNVTDTLEGAEVTAFGTSRFKILQFTDAAQYTFKDYAYAGRENFAPVCLLSMDSGASPGILFKGDGTLKGPDCVMWSNSTQAGAITFQGSSNVTAKVICSVGSVRFQGANKVTPAPESGCEPLPNPMETWSPPSTSAGCGHSNLDRANNTISLSPGVYCGNTTINGENITLSAGVYVIRNGSLTIKGKTTIKGDKVLILLSGASNLDFNSSGVLSFSADTAGGSNAVVIAAADQNASGSIVLKGNTRFEVGGTINAPKHTIEVQGNSDLIMTEPQTTMIGKTITVDGSGSIIFKPRVTGKSPRWVDGSSVARLTR